MEPSPETRGNGGGSRRARSGRRRAWVDPGRWLTQRQRLGLDGGARPAPPERLAPISSLIPSLIEEIQDTAHLHVEELARQWPDLVGPAVAGHARPGTLCEGVLTVFVDHSTWLSELQRFHAARLLEKVKAAYPQGGIRRLVLRLDPDLERPGRPGR